MQESYTNTTQRVIYHTFNSGNTVRVNPGQTVTDDSSGYDMGVVVHGTNANVARPSGYSVITWVGSVEPTKSIDNDIWNDTSA